MATRANNILDAYLVDNGVIACRDKESGVRIIETSVKDFAAGINCDKYSTVRLLGCHRCAKLFLQIYTNRRNNILAPDLQILLGCPVVNVSNAKDPIPRYFEAMDAISNRPASVGGWHVATEADYFMYLTVASYDKCYGPAADLTLRPGYLEALRRHPAYPAISFIPTSLIQDIGLLLWSMVDVRWFIDPLKPDRNSRMQLYMGLTKKNLAKCLSADFDISTAPLKTLRTFILRRLWDTELVKTEGAESNLFVAKKHRAHNELLGVWSASKKYLRFVRDVWLHNCSQCRQEIFVPKYFFESEPNGRHLAEAYVRHAKEIAMTLDA